MAYIPKSKIQKLEATPQDNFINSNTLKPYMGPYVRFSNGRTYAGTSRVNVGFPIEIKQQLQSFNLNNNKFSRIYSILKPPIKSFLSKINTIISTKTLPTEEDYERGYYTRYFAKRVNSPQSYIEINHETFIGLITKSPKYDHNLYVADLITWAITGNVFKINSLNIKAKEQTHSYLSNFFLLINEFHRPDEYVQEDLYTNGEELYYSDGTEYIGDYHIHPKKGPMEGPKHTNFVHTKLYYINQLSIYKDKTKDPYKEFLESQKFDKFNPNIPKAKEEFVRDVSSSEREGGY